MACIFQSVVLFAVNLWCNLDWLPNEHMQSTLVAKHYGSYWNQNISHVSASTQIAQYLIQHLYASRWSRFLFLFRWYLLKYNRYFSLDDISWGIISAVRPLLFFIRWYLEVSQNTPSQARPFEALWSAFEHFMNGKALCKFKLLLFIIIIYWGIISTFRPPWFLT